MDRQGAKKLGLREFPTTLKTYSPRMHGGELSGTFVE